MSMPIEAGGAENPRIDKEGGIGDLSRTLRPLLEVEFEGTDISPEKIPVDELVDVIRAVQRLVNGQRPDGAPRLSNGRKLRLLEIRRGSTRYILAGSSTVDAGANLSILGNVMNRPAQIGDNEYILRPIGRLSRASARLNCHISIREPDPGTKVFARIGPDSYEYLADSVLISGQTEYCGKVIRVVNSRRSKCALRVAFQTHLMMCHVPDSSMARKMGVYLDQKVIVSGEATWLRNSWRVFSFRVDAVRPLAGGSLVERIKAIRGAGGSDWDRVTDVQAFLDGDESVKTPVLNQEPPAQVLPPGPSRRRGRAIELEGWGESAGNEE